ncbi:MAG: arylesterase [Myxococcota bacterium]
MHPAFRSESAARAARRRGRYWLAPGRAFARGSLRAAAALAACAALASCGERDALSAAAASEAGAPASASAPQRPVVLFVGTSLTAGYGLGEDEAFPARIQERIDDLGLDLEVVNAGVSGDTSAGGLRRIDWLLRLPVAVLVLELGANDMLRGLDVDAMRANLAEILARTRRAHPDARLVVAGMRAAPNLGPDYGRRFDAAFPALAREFGATLVPFLLDGVAASRKLNQADGIHPTAEGHRVIAERLWPVLEPVLREAAIR